MKKVFRSYLTLLLVLFLLFVLPTALSDSLRSWWVALFSPFWKGMASEKEEKIDAKKYYALQLENIRLREELEGARAFLEQETFIQEQVQALEELLVQLPKHADVVGRHYRELGMLLEQHLQALPAKVIYRDPASWSSFLWVGVGEEDNKRLERTVVAKNSPVLFGDSVVGVVDEVEAKKSKVRLITDSSLFPSVRVARGYRKNRHILSQVEDMLHFLHTRESLPLDEIQSQLLQELLESLAHSLRGSFDRHLLAKGVLQGASSPLWRSSRNILRGQGFNYDHGDTEGEARDLRTGAFVDQSDPVSLLEEGDLLVTSGMDGVFPEGFPIALVEKRFPLPEGGYTYEIEAKPTAGNLNELSYVFIIPPLLNSR